MLSGVLQIRFLCLPVRALSLSLSLFKLIWLHWILVAAHKIFTFYLLGLVLWPGLEPGGPELREWSLSHWTTREIPEVRKKKKN